LTNLKFLNGNKIDHEDDIESIKFEDDIDNFNVINTNLDNFQ